MYKRTHENSQRRADALTINNLAQGEVVLSPEQRRDTLIDVRQQIVAEICALPKNHPRRKILATKQRNVEQQIRETGASKKYEHSFPSIFMEVAKKHLTYSQYRQFIMEAELLSKSKETQSNDR